MRVRESPADAVNQSRAAAPETTTATKMPTPRPRWTPPLVAWVRAGVRRLEPSSSSTEPGLRDASAGATGRSLCPSHLWTHCHRSVFGQWEPELEPLIRMALCAVAGCLGDSMIYLLGPLHAIAGRRIYRSEGLFVPAAALFRAPSATPRHLEGSHGESQDGGREVEAEATPRRGGRARGHRRDARPGPGRRHEAPRDHPGHRTGAHTEALVRPARLRQGRQDHLLLPRCGASTASGI